MDCDSTIRLHYVILLAGSNLGAGNSHRAHYSLIVGYHYAAITENAANRSQPTVFNGKNPALLMAECLEKVQEKSGVRARQG